MSNQDPWATTSRTEVTFSLRTGTHRHTYRAVNRLTVDDLVINMAKAEAHLIYTGEDLTSLADKEVVDYLLKTNLLLGSG